MQTTFTPDHCQQEVIEARGGMHLVLAPPGCGKTQILARRISQAHAAGVQFADMLCLTFTNRAARGMVERIATTVADEGVADVYVGNVHRFCSKFLYANALIEAESSVIDDDDAVSILARYMQQDEMSVMANYNLRRNYAEIFHFSNLMHQIRHRHPKDLRVHPECFNGNDVAAVRAICRVRKVEVTPEAVLDIYDHADTYRDMTRSDTIDYGNRAMIEKLLQKMQLARQYADYKHANRLYDFNDLLMLAYDALSDDPQQEKFKRYSWIQVDEVQDLNPLQMAIVDLLTAREADTVMFLGDEQQAIFSFMGAKMSTLDALKNREACVLHHLGVNHRSPAYLLEVFNRYAEHVLCIDPAMLPQPDGNGLEERTGNELAILQSSTKDEEVCNVAMKAAQLNSADSRATTAIIVNSNSDADVISRELDAANLAHFKISGSDMFSLPETKLLLAHLGVLNNDFNFLAWARILAGVKVFASNAVARNFVRKLFDLAILPSDLLRSDGQTTLGEFVEAYENDTIVVFDTETTGLDVLEDDIVQIAAVKMSRGKVVPGSAYTVYIETDKDIPAMLGDVVNPIIEERRHHRLVPHAEALNGFINYARGCVLLAHNADYDYNILDNNLKRYCADSTLHSSHPRYIDSLRLARLLHPELRQHKLKFMLEAFGLEGTNSHLADDDVDATCHLVNHCYAQAAQRIEEQRKFLADSRVAAYADKFRANYAPLYASARVRIYDLVEQHEGSLVASEMMLFHDYLTGERYIQPIAKLHYAVAYISSEIVDSARERSLAAQLAAHLMEISTLKEADMCGSNILSERIFVTTIHKAKGLEFDNVIVFDVADGRIPNYYNEGNARLMAEDARKLYVAMTRARRRLYIACCNVAVGYMGRVYKARLSRFLNPVLNLFS